MNRNKIMGKTYLELANEIFLEKYEMKQIQELIFTLYLINRMPYFRENKNEIINFIKTRVSKKIYRSIKFNETFSELLTSVIDLHTKTLKKEKELNEFYSKLVYMYTERYNNEI